MIILNFIKIILNEMVSRNLLLVATAILVMATQAKLEWGLCPTPPTSHP